MSTNHNLKQPLKLNQSKQNTNTSDHYHNVFSSYDECYLPQQGVLSQTHTELIIAD